ncbi:hypothetical protein SUDANB121_01252 [Nocardiopsis dassonvillei]|uniref:protein kinase domain-containing protein n=1 Tax=Nocardiopsis dassonvillei TaxID=2014 RepID=UPI003F56021E
MSLSLYVGPDSQPDKYRLVRSVGRGGEATLYLAEVTLAGQTEPVVVKALNADITADSAQFSELSARWAEQAELLRFINRLGVVGVREHFEGAPEHPQGHAGERSDRCLYLVMNHIDGLDLRDWRAEHAREGVRGQREVLRYLEQVAQVLDMLHAGRATPSRRPVVHGDLSPGNVMIDADGQATLVDFGLSRIAARHMTARPWFTPGYAAPEIFSGEYSPATDRYAFGAVAFYALTGEDPPTAPEQLRERFTALPLLAGAEERTRALVASMFSAEPSERPEASEWVRALRTLATSVPWTGPGGEPAVAAGDPGTSAVFAASLFTGAAPSADPVPEQDTGATTGSGSSVLPQGPAVAGPPPESLPVPDRAPASGGTGDGSAPSAEAGGTDATVVLSPPSGAGAPVPGDGASGVPGAVSAGAAGGPDGASVPGTAAGGDTDATVVLPPPSGAGAPVPGDPQASGDSSPDSSGAVSFGAPGAAPASHGTAASGGAAAPGSPEGNADSDAPQNSSAAADGARDPGATAVLPPDPGAGTPAAGTPSAGGREPSDTEATAVLPGDGPGVEDMPHRPVGGMRGRPAQQRPDPAPAQPGTPPAPSAPQPRRPVGPTPPGGMARPPMPRPGSAPLRSGPAHSGPAYGPPPVQSRPAWGPPPPPGSTGAFPAYGHPPAPEPPAERRKSRKPLFVGLAAFAVLCMIGGSALTYVVMDRGLPFLSDGPRQVAADASDEPPAAEAEEEAPPMAAAPGESPKGDASAPDTGSGDPGAPAPGDTTLLTQLAIVDNHAQYWLPDTGRAELNGEAHTRALVSTGCGDGYNPCTGWAEYNLGRKWSAFTATIGVDDTSSASATTTFTVLLDGEPEVTETLRLGETLDIEVDVRDVLRLRIQVESDDDGVLPVWADPTLTA